jgi:DNA-binding NarL/FixJ family response regulator
MTDTDTKTTIERILTRRSTERVRTQRWNYSSLILIYVVLVVVIILTLREVHVYITGGVAVVGLLLLLLSERLTITRNAKRQLEQDISLIKELWAETGPDVLTTTVPGISPDLLSEREQEVMALVARGQSNKAIADTLAISNSTVRNHITHIFEKLEVTDRTSAVMKFLDPKLVDALFPHPTDKH